MFLSWRSLVARSRGNRDGHHLIGAIWSHLLVASNFFNTSKSKSFQYMFNEGGQDTGGYFGIVAYTKRDLEYFKRFHGQPWWNAPRPCWTSLPCRQSRPLLESLPRPTCIPPDLMHTKHLGTDKRLLGSVAWVLITQVMDQGSVEERLFVLLQELKGAFFELFQFSCFLFNFAFCCVSILIIVCDCVGWIARAMRKRGQLTDYMAAFPNSHLVADSKAVQVVLF